MSRQIQKRFDRAGATYEGVALVQRQVAAHLAGLCPKTLAGPVLEIGAGSGLLTRLLVPRLAAGPYVALDLSPGMLAHAAMPGAARLAADGERPPFAPETFGFLASASAMHWYGDPARSIPADLGLLRPGGGFALALYVAGTLGELAETAGMTGFGTVYPMRPTTFYRELFAALPGVDWRLEETRHTVWYPGVKALLQGLKSAGVTHAPGRRAGSPARYREFSRLYQERFATARGVPASYVVASLRGTRLGTPAARPGKG